MKKRIALVSTGGTIEKTYDQQSGMLSNREPGGLHTPDDGQRLSVLDVMLPTLVLRGVAIQRVALMNKDSLDMTPDDHTLIAETALRLASQADGVVVVHGTDRLSTSGERIVALLGSTSPLQAPIVFTGAMRPYELRSSDALQNLTEALLAVQIVAPGVYVAMHSQVLQFPGVVKDYGVGAFVKAGSSA